MPRILLVRTNFRAGLEPPLGVLCLATAIRQWAPTWQIRILDTGPARLGAEAVAQAIADFAPDFLGLSALTCDASLMHECAAAAKHLRPGLPIAVGGPHATCYPDGLAADANIDFICVGEGEHTIVELLEALEGRRLLSDVAGLLYRADGEVKHTPPRAWEGDLDSLGIPAWDLLHLELYSMPGRSMARGLKQRPVAALMTSRGCPYGCVYCHNMMGRQARFRSPEHVLAEVDLLHHRHGVKELHIVDDIFNLNLDRAKRILAMIADRGYGLSLAFPNGLRSDRFDPEFVRALKRAGTYKLYCAIESGSPRVQSLIRKRLDLVKAAATVRQVRRAGITAAGFFMLGFPTESPQEIGQTINFALRHPFHVASFFKVVPFPGTRLYQMLVDTGQAPQHSFDSYVFHAAAVSASDLPLEELNDLVASANWLFYARLLAALSFLRTHPNRRLALYLLRLVYGRCLRFFWQRARARSRRPLGALWRLARYAQLKGWAAPFRLLLLTAFLLLLIARRGRVSAEEEMVSVVF